MRLIWEKEKKCKVEEDKDTMFTVGGRPVPPEKLQRFR